MDNIMIALKIMGQGMLGIFVSIILIALVVAVMGKFSGKKEEKK